MRSRLNFPLSVGLFLIFLFPALHSDDFFMVKKRVMEESRFELGFLYLTPLLKLENVGYSNSIYNYENQQTPDWTADVGVGLRASAVAANRFILQVEDQPYYSYYLETENQRAWSNGFKVNAYSYAGPFNFKAGYAQDNLRQRPNLEFGRPFHYETREWSGEVDIGRSGSFFVTAYVRSKILDYGREPYLDDVILGERLNHRQDVFGFKLNKKIFTGTVVYADYAANDYVFAFAPDRDARARQFTLGVEFPELGALQGSFQAGIKRFDPANPLFQHPQRPTGRGDVRLMLANRLRLNIFYELQTYFSYNSSDSFYDNQSFGGGAEFYVTRFLKVGASLQEGRLKHYSFLDLALWRSDRQRSQRFFLAAPFLGKSAIGLSYNIYRLTSAALAFDQSYSFWGGFITYAF